MLGFDKKTSFEEYFKIQNSPKTTIPLEEAQKLVTKSYKLGETPFVVSSLKDDYIKKMIQAVADRLGKSYSELEALIQHSVDEDAKNVSHSKALNETEQKNAVENTLYRILDSYNIDFEEAPKFKPLIFKRLFDLTMVEHNQLFPLKTSGIEKNRLNISPKITFLPKSSKFKTAAIDDKAQIYVNEHFMQQLITYAWLRGLKPKGNKYKSNGGTIPDEYGYIEFVILHELLHYVYDENYFSNKYPKHKHLINIAGDYRINYVLVKSGYPQLPLGLFSDHLNLDRQDDYLHLLTTIDEELKKSPQRLKSHDSHKKPEREERPDDEEEEEKTEAPREPYNKGDIVVIRASNKIGFVADSGTSGTQQKDGKEVLTQKMKIVIAEEKNNVDSSDTKLVERLKKPSKEPTKVNGVEELLKGDVISLKSGEVGIVRDISKQDDKGNQKLHMDIIPKNLYNDVINAMKHKSGGLI